MVMNALTSYDDGLAFAHSYRVLIKKHMLSRTTMNYRDSSLIIPAMVNGAFACELFLKSLFKKEVRGHKLGEIFTKLEREDKNTYDLIVYRCISALNSSDNKKYDETTFVNELNTFSNSFVEIRYFYENNPNSKNYNLKFIDIFISVLESICEMKYGLRPPKS